MMVLRDFYCNECGNDLHRDLWADIAATEIRLQCPSCRQTTMHSTVCNGGCKARWRHNDFSNDPTDYFGQTSHSVSVVDEETGADVELLDGGKVADLPKFKDPDIRAEKRDRAEHRVKQERGKNPIYVG